jgi:hypothetical protein
MKLEVEVGTDGVNRVNKGLETKLEMMNGDDHGKNLEESGKLENGNIRGNSTFTNKTAIPHDENQVTNSSSRQTDVEMEMMDSRRCGSSGWLKEKKLLELIPYK